MESSGETPVGSTLVRTTTVLALETECGSAENWVAQHRGGCSYSKIRIKTVFERK